MGPMNKWLGQLRLRLHDNTTAFVVALTVLVLAGGAVTYSTHISPGTEIEQRETATWSSTAMYTHEATVQTETPVFTENQTLSDRSVYLRSVAPELDGRFVYGYQASESGTLSANATVTLVTRSVNEEVELWREERQLATGVEQSLGPGEEFVVPFTINMTEQQQRVASIENQLGGTPGETEFTVRTRLTLTGERNGAPVEQTSTYTFSIDTNGQTYSVTGATPERADGEQTEQYRVTASYGPIRSVGGPVLLAGSLLCLVGFAVLHLTGSLALSDVEREWLAFRSDAQTFDEWITRGTLSVDETVTRRIDVDSLEGLVDVAIDSNRRVILDESRGLFVVLLEETVYQYDPPSFPGDGQLAAPGTPTSTAPDDRADGPDEDNDNEAT
ncbi:hypothetical protein GRX03_03905 [Halovenus sp. WSH3]|uniref:DUF5305 domain-containing protein n=1 Tax=Halovenus carboxidivorans TaxID=2692199 RepID=A0A6B0T782_9EURY|nr:DUF5305 domain-containing protein [Halovenus carboxidivorans]MXR50750.1 hypothetical protein [Halovenus carboxidivorans]